MKITESQKIPVIVRVKPYLIAITLASLAFTVAARTRAATLTPSQISTEVSGSKSNQTTCYSTNTTKRRALPAVYSNTKAINYSPYRAGGPNNGEIVSPANILQDLSLLNQSGFKLIRLFGNDLNNPTILKLAQANYPSMRFQLGSYIESTDNTCLDPGNITSITNQINYANTYPNVATVSIGNETSFLDGAVPVNCLAAYISAVKNHVSQPVTADDDYGFYAGLDGSNQQPDAILPLIDFASIHSYPTFNADAWNWQQLGVSPNLRANATMTQALAFDQFAYAKVRNYRYANQVTKPTYKVSIGNSMPIVIGETGWKSALTFRSSVIEDYTASPINAKQYLDLLHQWQHGELSCKDQPPLNIFYFEAFDEAWKGIDSGWGLWNANRQPLYPLCGVPASGAAACSKPNPYAGAGYAVASPFKLFASTYVSYPAQTNGAYLHSAEGGDVYTSLDANASYAYATPQNGINYFTGVYSFLFSAVTPTTNNYITMQVNAPNNGQLSITEAKTLLITMGNALLNGGSLNVLSVDLTDASQQAAAQNHCTFVQNPLFVVGPGLYSVTGTRTYAIPLNQFSCDLGSLANLQAKGVGSVTLTFNGALNPAVVAGEVDGLGVGMIGFTNQSQTADVATLNTDAEPASSYSAAGSAFDGAGADFTLFASSYVVYPNQTNGAYLHSIQGGDVYGGFGGGYGYGYYSAAQPDMNRTNGLYVLQMMAGAAPAPSDYMYVAVVAPNDAAVDISQAKTLLITLGNNVTPDGTNGHANVITVTLNDSVAGAPGLNNCSYNQTLLNVGQGQYSQNGSRVYAIPLSAFSCSQGNLSLLKSTGVSTVALNIVGAKNPGILPGEFDIIAVGMIGFSSKELSNADLDAINKQ